MARHRATRPSVASVVSATSTNGTPRARKRLSYEQNALLALAENSIKQRKKRLSVSAIVKDAERRAHEQGLELGVRARPSIKKAVERLAERGAVAEAPRNGRAPAEYRLTPKAVKHYNDAKSHRKSDIGIAKETLDIIKGNDQRPNKRRRNSISATTVLSSQLSQAKITELESELVAARSEIASLKKSNGDLLDQQLDDDDEYDIFGSPFPSANNTRDTEWSTRPSFSATHGLSLFSNRHTRPTTPELTENGSPEYDAPGDFDFGIGIAGEITPPSPSLPDAAALEPPQKSEMELKMERLETSMSELALEKAQMAEEIAALKNQVEHERQNANHLALVRHEADMLRVELVQASKARDSALKETSHLTKDKEALERHCADLASAKDQLEDHVSRLNETIEIHVSVESNLQSEIGHLDNGVKTEAARNALLTANLAARDSMIAELQDAQNLANNQLQTLREEGLELRKQLVAVQDHASRAEGTIHERDLEILNREVLLKTSEATIGELKRERDELVNDRSKLRAEFEAAKLEAGNDAKRIDELERDIQGLRVQTDDLNVELDAVRTEKDHIQAKAETDSAAAGQLIAQRDVAIAEHDIQLAKLEADLNNRVQELSARQARITQLNTALNSSNETIKSLRVAQKATEQELANAVNTNRALGKAIADHQAKDKSNAKRITELKAELVQQRSAFEEQQDVMSKLEIQLDTLRKIELESLRRRRARIEAEAKRLRDEEADLTRETIDVDQWDEGLSQSRAARASLAPSFGLPSSP